MKHDALLTHDGYSGMLEAQCHSFNRAITVHTQFEMILANKEYFESAVSW